MIIWMFTNTRYPMNGVTAMNFPYIAKSVARSAQSTRELNNALPIVQKVSSNGYVPRAWRIERVK